MSIETEKKSTKEKFSSFMHSTVDLGKKAASGTKTSVMNMVEKAKASNEERQKKKLNPVFRKDFKSKKFKIPNVIKIVDDAVRRNQKVCDGAIGWLQDVNKTEFLFLYDEEVEFSKLQFIPSPDCNAIYCVDPYNRNRFIRSDRIFDIAHDERLAELKHIAHSLGAKKCTIRIVETDSKAQENKASITGQTAITTIASQEANNEEDKQEETDVKDIGGVISCGKSSKSTASREGSVVAVFEGSNERQRPNLKWFAHEGSVKQLVDICCSGKNTLTSEELTLFGSSYATMTQTTAASIDYALKSLKLKGTTSMEKNAIKEHSSKLYFQIEF